MIKPQRERARETDSPPLSTHTDTRAGTAEAAPELRHSRLEPQKLRSFIVDLKSQYGERGR